MLINFLPHRKLSLMQQRQSFAQNMALACLAALLTALGLSQLLAQDLARAEDSGLQLRQELKALDAQLKLMMQRRLLDIWQETGKTVIFVTHSITEAVYLSNRVIVMAARPGRIVEEVIIDEPYPRNADFRVSHRFATYAKQLQDCLLRASGAQEDEALA